MGVPLVEVTPTEVKMASVGSKTATKEEMITWAVSKYPDINWPKHGKSISAAKAEHMADAIGALHAGVLTSTFKHFIKLCESK
jgi:Holliday junction resolvasome RuvABC endonuclease subunit